MKEANNRIKLYNRTIKEGNLSKITALLCKGADIDSIDKKGRTALWWAAFNGNLELATFLIENKANPNISDYRKKTPLDIAAELALGGYREPGEINNHAQLVIMLKRVTEELYQKEIDGITEKISNLGIHDAKSAQIGNTSIKNTQVIQELEQPKNGSGCTIL
jgi:hypothetical protein